jgi:hypothetical protein
VFDLGGAETKSEMAIEMPPAEKQTRPPPDPNRQLRPSVR